MHVFAPHLSVLVASAVHVRSCNIAPDTVHSAHAQTVAACPAWQLWVAASWSCCPQAIDGGPLCPSNLFIMTCHTLLVTPQTCSTPPTPSGAAWPPPQPLEPLPLCPLASVCLCCRGAWLRLRQSRLTGSALANMLSWFDGQDRADHVRLWREKLGLQKPPPGERQHVQPALAEFSVPCLTLSLLTRCLKGSAVIDTKHFYAPASD